MLLFILLHKIGDTLANLTFRLLFDDLGFTNDEIAIYDVGIGFWAYLIGIFIGGILYAQLGMKRSVLISLVLMAVSNFSFALLAASGHSNWGMAGAIGFENIASGIGGVCVVAYFSALCDLRFTASQYALISAAASIVGRFLTGTTAGGLIDWMGYVNFYLLTTVAAVPGIVLFWMMMRSGLVDSSIGSAGTAGSGDVTAENPTKPTPKAEGEAAGQAEAKTEAEGALVREFAVGGEGFAGQVERAEDGDRRAASSANCVLHARNRCGSGKAELQREAGELGGLVAFVAGHRDRHHRAGGRGQRLKEAVRVLVGKQADHQQRPRLGPLFEPYGNALGGVGIVAAVDPNFAAAELRKRAGRKLVQPRRPARLERHPLERLEWHGELTLVAQHGDRQRAILILVLARKARQRHHQRPLGIAILKAPVRDSEVPAAESGIEGRAHLLGNIRNRLQDVVGIIADHQRHAGLGDRRFLLRDDQRVGAEELLVVDAERGDPAHRRTVDDVGGIQPAAEADLDDARIGWGPRESEEGGRGGHLEEARLDVGADVEDLFEQRGQRLVLDQAAGDADALVEADQVRAGESVDLVTRGLQPGAQERAGRSLAVGAGDVEHGRQRVLRAAERVEQPRDPVEPELVAAGREQRQAVELRLDGRAVRPREIGHQAAFFSGIR